MANNVSQNHTPDLLGGAFEVNVGGVVEVTGPLIGWSIIDGLRRKFSASGQMEEGDYFMDRSRELLRRHLQLIEVNDQDTIRVNMDDVRDAKSSLKNFSGSRYQRFVEAKRYRCLSKVTYKIVKLASERGIDGRLMDQLAEAGGRSRSVGTGPAASMPRNPFTDSHEISRLTDVTVNNLDRVELSTYHAETTDGAAVVMDLISRDKSTQHLVATFSTEAFSGNGADSGAPEVPAGISLHREDGTTPHFIAAYPPDVSPDERANEVETGTVARVASIVSDEMWKSEDGRSSFEAYGGHINS